MWFCAREGSGFARCWGGDVGERVGVVLGPSSMLFITIYLFLLLGNGKHIQIDSRLIIEG